MIGRLEGQVDGIGRELSDIKRERSENREANEREKERLWAAIETGQKDIQVDLTDIKTTLATLKAKRHLREPRERLVTVRDLGLGAALPSIIILLERLGVIF